MISIPMLFCTIVRRLGICYMFYSSIKSYMNREAVSINEVARQMDEVFSALLFVVFFYALIFRKDRMLRLIESCWGTKNPYQFAWQNDWKVFFHLFSSPLCISHILNMIFIKCGVPFINYVARKMKLPLCREGIPVTGARPVVRSAGERSQRQK